MEQAKTVKRVFLYARVSTEEQAVHGLSIEAQTAALEAWAKANSHKVAGLYVDAGISARKPATKRPELQRLLNDVRAGKGELIVFTKLDRWFRNIAEYYKVQEVLEKHHVDWRTIQEDYDTSTASGRLKINIMLSVAQDEADRTSERIKAVFEMKRQKLEPLTGKIPYGYIINGKKLEKDPQTEQVVEAFFRFYLSSGSISDTQRSIFQQFGVNFNYERTHRMLHNTAYYGRYFGADGMVPAYISKQEYDQIQSMRHKVVRKSPKNHIFLFSGITFCSECGRRMGARAASTYNYQYYRCPNSYLAGKACINHVCISEKVIESFLLDSLEEKVAAKKLEYAAERQESRKKDCKAELAATRKKLKRIKELYVNELIDIEDYRKDYAEYTQRIEDLMELDRAQTPPDFTVLENAISGNWKEAYAELTPERKRKVWRSVIQEIRVYPDRHIEFDLNLSFL